MKYVNFGNNVNGYGFGNQLRAFPLSYLCSKLTGRELFIDNYWIKNIFNIEKNNIEKNNKSIFNALSDYGKIDYKGINQDIIEFGGGTFPTGEIINHNLYSEEIKSIMGESTVGFYKKSFDETFMGVNKEFETLSKKIVDYDNNDYISIQFRAFFDVGNKNMVILDKFIDKCINLIKEKELTDMPIFITSDNSDAIKTIKKRIGKEFGSRFIETIYNFGHSGKKKDLRVLCDWLINSKSKLMLNTGTTYSLCGSWIFNTTCYIFKDNDLENIENLQF